jgi:4-diphosphocytidyl-2-C-methyl-D-erythritol kinase
MNTLVIRALAKINLAIDVLDKRSDGYHSIDMVTIPLKLHDSIEMTRLPSGGNTYLYCDDPTIVCDESNLAYKALDATRKAYHADGEYRLFIYKKIPVEAGLGGGSADAAAIIKALRPLIPGDVENVRSETELAISIGSDVPFCLFDKPARVRGKGEQLDFIKVATNYSVLIVKPNFGLSTKTVYEAYDLISESIPHPNIPELIDALGKGDEASIQKNLVNVLSVPAIRALPLIGDILAQMRSMGFPLCGMSGTGSASFALSKDRKALERASHVFEKAGYNVTLTEFAL